MNWRLVTLLSDFGFVMGALAVLGLAVGIEWVLWLLFWVVASFVLAKKVGEQLFQHAFAVGLLSAIFSSILTVIFFDRWAINYPEIYDVPLNPKLYLILVSLFIGAASGAILGGLTLLNRKLLNISPGKPAGKGKRAKK